MLDKITFRSGVLLSSLFLNEVQKSPTLNYSPRSNFYSSASDSEESLWPIGQRDSLKDWELPDPSKEPSTTLGRFAYDGIILGCNNCSSADTDSIELIYGPPRVSNKGLNSEVLNNNNGVVFVNAGTIYDSQARKISWSTTQVIITPGEINYIYLTYDYELELVEIVSSNNLPSIAISYIPLAKMDIANNFEISNFEDLRPGTYIDIIESKDLSNSDIISETLNTPVQVWRRNLVDTSNGEVTLLLPSAKDSDRISFLDISGTFSRNNLNIITDPNSSDRIHGDYKLSLDINDSHVSLVYVEALQEWRIEDIDYSDISRDSLGEFVSCGGQYCIGITSPENCPNGAPIPPVFPEQSEGYFLFESTSDSQGKCYKVINPSWSIYSDGQGGFLQFPNERRCNNNSRSTINKDNIAVLYVDQANGDDSYVNNGETVPFRTLERALLQAARREKRYSIHLSPGEYYVDNSPGSAFANIGDIDSGFHNLLDTGIKVFTFDSSTNILILNSEDYPENYAYPPEAFQVGKTIYSSSGSVATISKIKRKKQCVRDCGWILYLINRKGTFSSGENLFTNDLSSINSISGGLIVPHGTSIIGSDLRKTIIRPLFVPDVLESGNDSIYILKLTRNSYIKGITFSDNLSKTKTHHKLTAIGFASEEDIESNYQYNAFYEKVKIAWNDNSLSPDPEKNELEIVAPVPKDTSDKYIDIQENITGEESPDSIDPDPEGFYRYPGKIRFPSDENSPKKLIPDINSVRNSSPFVNECSVRSIFGLNGVYADGRTVRGFKSILVSGFTQVSIQIDPDAFEDNTYFSEPFLNTSPKKYKSEYRHYGFKASHDAYIQINSCFVIGNAIHFTTECGGQLTILNSVSNFGDVSILPRGYCLQPLPQDIGIPFEDYLGTRITQVIPPKPIEGNIEEYKFNTGLAIDIGATRKYFEQNSLNNIQRIYIRAYNIDNHLSLTNPPSSKLIESNNIFTYTKRDSNNNLLLSTEKDKLNSLFIKGKNNEIYHAKISTINTQEDIYLDDNSRIFFWDENPVRGYNSLGSVPTDIDTDGKRYFYKDFSDDISSANTFFNQIGENNSFLKINDKVYQIRDKFIEENLGNFKVRFFTVEDVILEDNPSSVEIFTAYSDFTGGLWYIEVENVNIEGSSNLFNTLEENNLNNIVDLKELYIHRNIDLRSDEEKIYRIKLEGFDYSRGKRSPQEYFIFEEQSDINPDIDDLNFNLDSPLIISHIESSDSEPGNFYAVLCKADEINNIVPKYSIDDPYMEEEISSTIWAAEYLFSRENYYFYDSSGNIIESLEENLNFYTLKYKRSKEINIQLHAPSTIRSTNHSWEWIGYLNYDSSLPSLHLSQISQEDRLKKILTEENGGKGYISGMTEDGQIITSNNYRNYTISKDRINPETPKNINSFKELNIQYRLGLLDYSSLIFSEFSKIIFSKNTLLYNREGTNLLSEDNRDYAVYANESRAGLVQLSDQIAENDSREYLAVSPKRLLESKSLLTDFATEAEINEGSLDNKAISPAGLNSMDAEIDKKGLVTLANSQKLIDRNTNHVLIANNLSDDNLKASTERSGLIELATQTDFDEGSNNNKAITPNLMGGIKSQLNTLNQTINDISFSIPDLIGSKTNHLRLSHISNSKFPTAENTSAKKYSSIFVHGNSIGLWNNIENRWEMVRNTSNYREYALNTNLDYESNSLQSNRIYNLFIKGIFSESGNFFDDFELKAIILENINDVVVKDGIHVFSLDPSYRFVGRLLTSPNNSGEYIQDLGGSYIDNDNGDGTYSLTGKNLPKISLINFENRIRTEIRNIHENALINPPDSNWIKLQNYIQILSCEDLLIEGYSSIRNNKFTLIHQNNSHYLNTRLKTIVEKINNTVFINPIEDTSATVFLGEISNRGETTTSNFSSRMYRENLIARIYYSYQITGIENVDTNTITINENPDLEHSLGTVVHVEV